MINNFFKKNIPIIIMLFMFSALPIFAVTYIPLQPDAFPGVTNTSSNLGVYLGSVFNFGIAVAVTLALVMIIWGGIMYMTTDAWEKKNEGKDKITNALYGLGLALISWLLLYTINPCLVNFVNINGCTANNTFINAPQTTK